VRLHAFGLADSAPHNKSTARGHLNLDFAVPSVQLAGRLLVELNLSNFLAELKPRNLVRMAGLYPRVEGDAESGLC